MIHKKTFSALALAFVLVAGLATAGILYAQNRMDGTMHGDSTRMGGMMGMMSMMENCPMMGAMSQDPGAALEHREDLGLTDQQVQKLEVLAEGTEQARAEGMERMMALHDEIAAVTDGEAFNEVAVRTAFDRMGDLHTAMGVAMLRTRHEVRQTLTPEQREELSELGGGMMGMQGMMGMMGGMDMENCPMMQDGMMSKGMDNMNMQMQGAGHGSMES